LDNCIHNTVQSKCLKYTTGIQQSQDCRYKARTMVKCQRQSEVILWHVYFIFCDVTWDITVFM